MSVRHLKYAAVAVIMFNIILLSTALTACDQDPANAPADIPAAGEAEGDKAADTNPEPAQTRPIDASKPCITFVINVHDTEHVDESADTIVRLVSLFEKYGVRGDFYVTAPVVEQYAQHRPDAIERLKNSNMTISYHVRPPHPLYTGFDQSLNGLDDAALRQTLLDYETYRLDMATGGLDRSRPGGYTYVAQVFGRNPVAAPSPNESRRVADISRQVYANLGARMTLTYHEEGTDPAQPFIRDEEMLVRPSDIGVTRWGEPGPQGKGQFWWDKLDTAKAADFNPTRYLQTQLAAWNVRLVAGEVSRQPFVTSLIHENNFARSGAEGWTLSYFSGGSNGHPLSPPYDLNAPDPSVPRSPEDKAAIWAAYEEMVAWSAANLNVVTSEDIVALAAGR